MVDGLLANIGVGIVSRFLSSLLATGFPVYLALGFHLQHFNSKSEAFLDKVSMTNRLLHVCRQKRFPMHPANSMHQVAISGRGSAFHQDLERLPVDWERVKIFHCRSTLHLEILLNHSKKIILSCNS